MKNRLIQGMLGGVLVCFAGLMALVWFTFRIYVPEDMCAVLIRKTGDAPPQGRIIATEPGEKGIQAEVLGPGRHFRNPYTWDWEFHELTVIPSGNPSTWEWIHSLSETQRHSLRAGEFQFKGDFPKIGLVTRKVGDAPPEGKVIVDRDSPYKGILREVLTPGTYKLNPYVYYVEVHPAVVIPSGFVGVVTNLFGEKADLPDWFDKNGDAHPSSRTGESADAGDAVEGEEEAIDGDSSPIQRHINPLAKPGQRGTLADVLQPGVYYINPKLQKVSLIEIGYNEYSQVATEEGNYRISFPSDTGYLIRVGVTVVWGIDPHHAAEIINEFGNVDRVLEKVIGPQLRSICRNIGSTYAARDFIQGEKRELFQRDLTDELARVCRGKNVEVLLCLVREIEVHAPGSSQTEGDVTEVLKRTIQESYIAIEKQRTNEKQRDAAVVKAQLEEVRKLIDITRENVQADTRIKVANIEAEGQKQAAETQAQAELEVAEIQRQVAELDARRIEILGQANAEIDKMKRAAEADGYRLLVEAFGSPSAYNLYTFAEGFKPESIRLIFAGDGTFWTDLSRFEEAGAATLLQSNAEASAH